MCNNLCCGFVLYLYYCWDPFYYVKQFCFLQWVDLRMVSLNSRTCQCWIHRLSQLFQAQLISDWWLSKLVWNLLDIPQGKTWYMVSLSVITLICLCDYNLTHSLFYVVSILVQTPLFRHIFIITNSVNNMYTFYYWPPCLNSSAGRRSLPGALFILNFCISITIFHIVSNESIIHFQNCPNLTDSLNIYHFIFR